jgi:hypothetical protein
MKNKTTRKHFGDGDGQGHGGVERGEVQLREAPGQYEQNQQREPDPDIVLFWSNSMIHQQRLIR